MWTSMSLPITLDEPLLGMLLPIESWVSTKTSEIFSYLLLYSILPVHVHLYYASSSYWLETNNFI